MELREAVEQELDRRGWSQAYVARRLGVKRAAVNNIVQGRSMGGSGLAIKLLALLGIDPASIDIEGLASASSVVAPDATPRQYHPGVEALAADATLRARHHVTDAEIAALRRAVLDRPLDTATIAVMMLNVYRIQADLEEAD